MKFSLKCDGWNRFCCKRIVQSNVRSLANQNACAHFPDIMQEPSSGVPQADRLSSAEPSNHTALPWNCNGQFVFSGNPSTEVISVARVAQADDARLIVAAVNALIQPDAPDANAQQRLMALEQERPRLLVQIGELTEALKALQRELAAEQSEKAKLTAHRDELLGLVRNIVALHDDNGTDPTVEANSV